MVDAGGTPAHCLVWQEAHIEALSALTPRIRRVVLRPMHWQRPLTGQHVDVRLTAEDGYQAQRSYSLLSPPEREGVYELAIERLLDGEVSPWFHDAAHVGDRIELIGPVGGHFVWRSRDQAPALLVGGGSGVVPLLAMAAHHAQARALAAMSLVIGARTLADVPLWDELQRWQSSDPNFEVRLALSRETVAPRAQDRVGRLQLNDLAAALQRLGDCASQSTQVFVCGSNGFVESVVVMLRSLNIPDGAVRTERFGG